ncbi:transcription factor EMB1444 isoform X1 [Typha latifolia]|uniref:transcription factor EMB1444 isoform X1 n=1 Tax=Typha latifolia TaxID=4733 RepID=UPI003C2E8D9D
MAPEQRAALGELCRGGGWSYAVIWRVDRRDPRLLIVEDSYFEEEVQGVVAKMLNQAHVVGEGIIGEAIVNGRYELMYSDTYGVDLSQTCIIESTNMVQGTTWWQCQFLAGIKTIVVIPLPSSCVVQFGSLQKVSESLEFIDKVKHLLEQKASSTGVLVKDAHENMHTYDQHGSGSSPINVCKHYDSVNSSQIEIGKDNLMKTVSSRDFICSSNNIYEGTFHTSGSHGSATSSTNPYVVAVPVSSSSTGALKLFCNSFQKPSCVNNTFSCHSRNQPNATMAESQIQVGPSTQLNSNYSNNKVATYMKTTSIGGLVGLPMMEHRLSSPIRVQGFPSFVSTATDFSSPSLGGIHQHEGSSVSYNSYGSCNATGTRSSESSKDCLQFAEKLLDSQNSSIHPFSVGDLCKAKHFGEVPYFVSEIPDTTSSYPEVHNVEQSSFCPSRSYPLNHLNSQGHQLPEMGKTFLTPQINDNLPCLGSFQSGLVEGDRRSCFSVTRLPSGAVENSSALALNSLGKGIPENHSLKTTAQLPGDKDLFGSMGLDLNPSTFMQDCWEDIIMPDIGNCPNLSVSDSDHVMELDMGPIAGVGKGLSSDSCLEQLLDAIVADTVTTNIEPMAGLYTEHQFPPISSMGCHAACKTQAPLVGFPSVSLSSSNVLHGLPTEARAMSHVTSWIDDSCSMKTDSIKIKQPKKPEEAIKVVKKRAKPGESTRPRPKDRQQIQDRVKELREIVPDGAKCSIDALLDRTIKHMIFLQSVTKYADKIKQADEPKMIGAESGVVLKDNSSGGTGGGATWAYEVAGQTMVCPIIVEDLNPPGQMLVEMICEERGFFLEIADIVRGFGLTILKGVMEIRDNKIWARFLVELQANREVTRLDIFLSLVQLLQQTSSVQSSDRPTKVDKSINIAPIFKSHHQIPISSFPVGLTDMLQCSRA